MLVQEGDRYIVRTPFAATVMTHWEAPYTGGADATIPAGFVFRIDYDPPPTATAVGGTPEEAERWQSTLVSAADLSEPKFAGYSVSVPLDALAAHCEKLPAKS